MVINNKRHTLFTGETTGLTTLLFIQSFFLFYPLRQLQLIYCFVGDKGETNDIGYNQPVRIVLLKS